MMRLIACLVLLTVLGDVSARPRRGAVTTTTRSSYSACSSCNSASPGVTWSSATTTTSSTVSEVPAGAVIPAPTYTTDPNAPNRPTAILSPDYTSEWGAIAAVNAARAARGLRPYVHDPALTQGAIRAALARARARLAGHTANDFAYLPPGASAAAGGCAAWPPGMGWGACCTYENHTYAGAASVRGPDGLMYHHLFVR